MMLTRREVAFEELKLLGTTCLHIAMKMEEVDLIELRQLVSSHSHAAPECFT